MARRRRRARLALQGRSWIQRLLMRFGWLIPFGALFVGAGVLAVTYAFASIPLPDDLELRSAAEVYDRNGNPIGIFSGEERRFLIDASELMEARPFIGQAVVAAEDKDFYEHNGVSFRGIARAAWANVTGGEIAQGGSTITQQYIKNAVLDDTSRTLTRKMREAILAIKFERRYTKDQILGFYLNTIYLGRGAYGIEAAARAYFDKSADELDLGEAAYLAGIIPSPESYQPNDNMARAIERRDRVLDVMVSEGFIGERRADRFRGKKVKLAKGAEDYGPKHQTAAYFMEWLRKDFLDPEFGTSLYTGGLKIYTTLDLDLQAYAEDSIDDVLTEPTEPEAALVSVTPDGEVRAFVGGRKFTNVKRSRGYNFASDNRREPGSAFKPFTLLAAIREGISPTESYFSGHSPGLVTDPRCAGPDGLWTPENYGGSSYGTMSLDSATTNSVNTVYAQLIAEIGPEKVANLLEEFDFQPPGGRSEIEPHCSLALGAGLDASPVELAHAYSGFAGRGELYDVNPLLFIENSEGDCIKAYRPVEELEEDFGRDLNCPDDQVSEPVGDQVVKANEADVLTQVLTHVVEAGTAEAAALPDGRPVAGKTGTTQDNKDAWFAGYVPQLTTVVWMGYQIEKPKKGEPFIPLMQYCADTELCRPVQGIEVTGGSFPAQIWGSYMAKVATDLPIKTFPEPEDLPDTEVTPVAPEGTYVPPPTDTGSEDTPKEEPTTPEEEPTTPTEQPTTPTEEPTTPTEEPTTPTEEPTTPTEEPTTPLPGGGERAPPNEGDP